MSKRRDLSERVSGAVAIATAIDGWVWADERRVALEQSCGGLLPADIVEQLAVHPRLQARLGGNFKLALRYSLDHPQLARHLVAPEAITRLEMLAGAKLAGGSARAFVTRDEIEDFVSRVGRDVWSACLDGGSGRSKAGCTPGTLAEVIAHEGRQAVMAAVADGSAALYHSIKDSGAVSWGALDEGDGARRIAAVASVVGAAEAVA